MSKPKHSWILKPKRIWCATTCVVLEGNPVVESDRSVYMHLSPEEATKLGLELIRTAREHELYLEEEARKAKDQAA